MANALQAITLNTTKSTPPKKRSIIPAGKHSERVKWQRRTEQEQNDIADEFLEWYIESDSHLFFNAFFAARFITYKVIRTWRKNNEYFNYIVELATEIREQRLQERLITTTSPTGIIFLMKNLHGYRNEPDQAEEGNTANDLTETTPN